ncbi:MAG TPA: hypothetical protein VHL79_14315 [Ramlibacter sp.]|nr:hypothetical protein [Ramlibacter sp.]
MGTIPSIGCKEEVPTSLGLFAAVAGGEIAFMWRTPEVGGQCRHPRHTAHHPHE